MARPLDATIGELGALSCDHRSALVEMLARTTPESRRAAAWALGFLGDAADSLIPVLRGAAAAEGDGAALAGEVLALGLLSRQARAPLEPAIWQGFLGHDQPDVRLAAAWAWAVVVPPSEMPEPAYDALLDAEREGRPLPCRGDADVHVRRIAIAGLVACPREVLAPHLTAIAKSQAKGHKELRRALR